MHFPKELVLPQRTIFRTGALAELPDAVRAFGVRGLVVHGHSLSVRGELALLKQSFAAGQAVDYYCRASGEPCVAEITDVIVRARAVNAQWIAGIGGGSVLDLAKAAAGLLHAEKPPTFYQEGGQLETPGIPFIAVPTTAGTGAEATPNAVIVNPAKKNKISIRDASFMARLVILDPALLYGMPPQVIAYAGLDALVQSYESFTSRNATWLTETLALKGLTLITTHLVPAYRTGELDDLAPLLLGSYLTGMAFQASRLGVIHGIAHPLGALYNVPHGLVCALCLVPSLQLNRTAMAHKYETLSDTVGEDFITRVKTLLAELQVPATFHGEPFPDKEFIINATLASGSTAANPHPVTRGDVEFLLRELTGSNARKKG